MRKNSWIALAAVTVVAVVGAVYVVGQRNAETDRGEAPSARLLPGLLAKVNDVAQIAVQDAKHKFTVVRQKDETWAMPEKSNYPVKPDAVKKAVVGMAELKALEPRTAKPDLYSKIGVDAPDAKGSESVQVDLKDAAGKEIAGIIAGKTKSFEGDVRPAQIYVRKVGDAQSWLAEGRFEAKPDPIGWLDDEIFKLSRDRVMSVEIDQPDVRRAMHSSSVGPIDENQLFYLETRGLPPDLARKSIVLSFLEPVVARIPLPEAQDRLRELLDRKWDAGRTALAA